MKKHYSLLLLVGVSMTCFAQANFAWKHMPLQKPASASAQVSDSDSDNEVESVVVVDEDFSLFAAGTEAEPDVTDITSHSTYRVNNSYTKLPNWGGYSVYQAGGACALLAYNHAQFGPGYGHISTPEMELYGEATVTFKARRAYSNPNAGQLWLALCDNSYGVLDDVTFQLTDEWQEFSWVTSEATFNNRNIFQFTPQNGELLVDDIKVMRKRNKLPKVKVLTPINNSLTEFVAQWEPSTEKQFETYLLNVYYKDWPEDIVEPGTLSIDFETINVKEDGQSIDTDNAGYPEGWTIDVSTNGKKDMNTTAGSYSSGSQSINFDAADDYILSPESPAPINRLSFWVKPSNVVQEEYNFSLINVQVKANDTWTTIANIPNFWLKANGGYYVCNQEVLGDYVTQIKLTCLGSYGVTFAIDDITLDYATQPVPYPLIVDQPTTETSYVVSDIDPTKEHYYYVQIKDGSVKSEPSLNMWVDGIIGITPKALPATNVKEDRFTANWEPIYNADRYKVSVTQEYVTKSANEVVEIVSEDFSGLTQGTLSNPKQAEDSPYYLADNGQASLDWILTNPVYVNGMAGSLGTVNSGAGLVLSPQIKLAANTIQVDFKAYNVKPGDVLWVLIMKDYDSSKAEYGYTFPFSKITSGYITGTATFENLDFGDAPMRIAFMTQDGGFYIDEVKISAIAAEAGTVVEKPYRLIYAEESEVQVDRIRKGEAQFYNYNVKALRTKSFVNYESEVSNDVRVDLGGGAGIEESIVSNNDDVVYVKSGVLHVVSSGSKSLNVYNMQGQNVLTATLTEGHNAFNLLGGIYIVNISGTSHKVGIK